jgi:2,5-diketo-D-gluconate reductase A
MPEYLSLNDGHKVPQVGLGLWQIQDEASFRSAFEVAIETGYRHFDTAQEYGNEALLGMCVDEADVARGALFITTKVWVTNYGPHCTERSLDASLEKLRTDYVDLALLHFPIPITGKYAWRALEDLQNSGKVRSIGVSNYTIEHLEGMEKRTGTMPSVNQVEMHVFQQQPELLAYCHEHGIAMEAYSPLAHGESMDNRIIAAVAQKHGKTYGQIMLRWCLEQGVVVLPKSTSPKHIAENIDIFNFSLDEADLAMLAVANRSQYTNHPFAQWVLAKSAALTAAL